MIASHEATLTGISGDCLMVLVNAPLEREEPAIRGLRLAVEMQTAVQVLIQRSRAEGHAIGFGVGAAMGPATVGTVGYEGRTDYTAIGSVINLAYRLCGSAADAQVLIDPMLAEAARGQVQVEELGARTIKGFDHPMSVYAVRLGSTAPPEVMPRFNYKHDRGLARTKESSGSDNAFRQMTLIIVRSQHLPRQSEIPEQRVPAPRQS